MSAQDTVRAWRDAEHRASLSETERAALPGHPAGSIELDDAELTGAVGAGYTHKTITDPRPSRCGQCGIVWD